MYLNTNEYHDYFNEQINIPNNNFIFEISEKQKEYNKDFKIFKNIQNIPISFRTENMNEQVFDIEKLMFNISENFDPKDIHNQYNKYNQYFCIYNSFSDKIKKQIQFERRYYFIEDFDYEKIIEIIKRYQYL